MKYLHRNYLVLCVCALALGPAFAGCGGKRGVNDGQILKEPDLFDTTVGNMPPAPRLIAPEKCEESQTINVRTEANDPDSRRFTYLYDLDGNGIFDDVSDNPSRRFVCKRDGVFELRVRVQDERGGTGEAMARLTVTDRGPQAVFKVGGALREGELLTFNADSSSSPADPLTRYEWDWNYDGRVFRAGALQGVRVEHRWMQHGVYVVALRVTDADGSSDIVAKTVTIEDQAPKAKIAGPKELLTGQDAEFSATDSASAADAIIAYYWDTDFRGNFNRRFKESRLTVRHVWHEAGDFRIALQVRDADGSVSTAVHAVRVRAPKPTAAKPPSK